MNGWGHVGRTQSPCRGCQDRRGECHASCEKYQEFVEIHTKERSEINTKKHHWNLGYGAPYRIERKFKEAIHKKK